MGAGGRLSSFWPWAVLAVVLACSYGAIRAGWHDQSLTKDEWPHLVRGLAYWNTGDLRLSFAHPPLANAIAALPARADLARDISTLPGWRKGDNRRVSTALQVVDYEGMRARLFQARVSMFAFLVLLAVYVFAFLRAHVGVVAAIAGATCVALNPTFLAHARLVTTDLPVTVFGVIAAGESIAFAISRKRWRLGTAAVALAACGLSKHSGLGIVAICVLVTALMLIAGRWFGEKGGPRAQLSSVVRYGATVALVFALALFTVYRFDSVGQTIDEIRTADRHSYALSRGGTTIGRVPGSLVVPSPSAWVVGLWSTGAHVERGHPRQWFWGKTNPRGHWAYFPTLIAIKSPLGFHVGWLTALFAAVGFAVSRRRTGGPIDSRAGIGLGLAACAGLLTIGLLSSRMNIGMRHALPLLGMLALFAGWGFERLWRAGVGWRVVAVIALLSIPVELAWTAPRYLSYFNVAVGPRRGHQISKLGESWGQTRSELVEYLLENDMQPVSVGTQTSAMLRELEFLGLERPRSIKCKDEQPNTPWAVILEEEYARAPRCYTWARKLEPDVRLVHHFRIYDLRESEPPPAPQATNP